MRARRCLFFNLSAFKKSPIISRTTSNVSNLTFSEFLRKYSDLSPPKMIWFWEYGDAAESTSLLFHSDQFFFHLTCSSLMIRNWFQRFSCSSLNRGDAIPVRIQKSLNAMEGVRQVLMSKLYLLSVDRTCACEMQNLRNNTRTKYNLFYHKLVAEYFFIQQFFPK